VKVKDLLDQTDVPIEVDGGINDRTIHIAHNLGATRFVATSFVFDSAKPPKDQYRALKTALNV
jgi:ribulose-phosphate 3-epimerase